MDGPNDRRMDQAADQEQGIQDWDGGTRGMAEKIARRGISRHENDTPASHSADLTI